MKDQSEHIVSLAKAIAEKAHEGQKRRDGVTPYIKHPEAVAARVYGESDYVRAAAWLHDVLEDTSENIESLREAGVPLEVIEAVQVLTKTGEDYGWYLSRVKAHPIARKVKVADMLSNLSDSPTKQQIVRYSGGLLFLLSDSP